ALECARQLRIVVVDACVDDGDVNGRTVPERLASGDRPHRGGVDVRYAVRCRLLPGGDRVRQRVTLEIGPDRKDLARRLQRGDLVRGQVRGEAADGRELAQITLVGRDIRIEARRKRLHRKVAARLHQNDDGLRWRRSK